MLIIYSKEKCQQCDAAKLLCQIKGVDFIVKMLDVDYSKEDITLIAPNARALPIITGFKEGVESYIGGLHQSQQILGGS